MAVSPPPQSRSKPADSLGSYARPRPRPLMRPRFSAPVPPSVTARERRPAGAVGAAGDPRGALSPRRCGSDPARLARPVTPCPAAAPGRHIQASRAGAASNRRCGGALSGVPASPAGPNEPWTGLRAIPIGWATAEPARVSRLRLVREETPVRRPAQTTAPARRWRCAGHSPGGAWYNGPPRHLGARIVRSDALA
jgi:hypothetical protein